jgi:hypothetical protein
MLQIYLVAIAVFGILIGIAPISAIVAHAQNGDLPPLRKSGFDYCTNVTNNYEDKQACYFACESAGIHDKQQNNPINQETLSKCGTDRIDMQEAYYKGYCGSNICKQPDSGSNSNDNGNGDGGGTPASP